MSLTKDQITAEVVAILEKTASDWDDDIEMQADTKLVEDLGLSSIDILHLSASISMAVKQRLPYDRLLVQNGEYVNDVTLGELVNFIEANLSEDYSDDAVRIRR